MAARLAVLSPQELDVALLLSLGMRDADIADTLFLATKTVKNRVSSVMAKGGFANRTEAAVYVARLFERQLATPWAAPDRAPARYASAGPAS